MSKRLATIRESYGPLAAIILIGFLIRLFFIGFDGFRNDVQTFESWTLTLRDYPLGSFYGRAGFADYPPGYLYVLAFLARMYAYVGQADPQYATLHVLVKLPGICFDLLTAGLAFVLVRRAASQRAAVIAAALVACNPAAIFISAYWGQVDSVAASFVLLLLLALDSGLRGLWRPLAVASIGWTALAISVLIKPPALLLAPLLLAWPAAMARRHGKQDRLVLWGATAFGIVFAIIATYLLAVPFAPTASPSGIFSWLIQRYRFGSNVYPYNSINAFNLYAITQPFWIPDNAHPISFLPLTQGMLGAVLVVVATLAFAMRFIALGTPLASLEAATLTLLTFFMLATRMHERYIFDGVTLAVLLAAFVQRYRVPAAILTVTLFMNLYYSLRYLEVLTNSSSGLDPRNLMPFASIPCAIVNVGLTLYLALRYFGVLPAISLPAAKVERNRSAHALTAAKTWFDAHLRLPPVREIAAGLDRRDLILAIGFALLSFAICFFHYGIPAEKIFDEIYYARSGEEYLKHLEQFEWTHPPLTKLIITVSMLLFGGLHGGDTAYGWRFLNIVIGAIMAAVVYAFGKRLTGSTLFASLAALFLIFDGFHFAQSRIATPEITVAFFCILTLYAFYRFWLAEDVRPEIAAPPNGKKVGIYAAALFVAAALGVVAAGHVGTKPGQYVPTWLPPIVCVAYALSAAYTFVRLATTKRDRNANAWLLMLTLSAGCLAASKWNGLFDFFVVWISAAALYLSRLFPQLRTSGKSQTLPLDLLIASMTFMGGTIYILSYIPYFMLGHSIFDMLTLQHSMYAYHADLRATHPYASAWWQWPILQRPISYYYHDFRIGAQTAKENACCVAEILALPNPVTWWLGLLSVPVVAVLGWIEKRRGYLLLVLAYFMQWLPWIASPRIAFEYHFFPNLAIICLCDALLLERLWRSARGEHAALSWQRVTCYAVCVASVAAFVYWYPIVSGTGITYHEWYNRVLPGIPFLHWI